jgi:hypothetical protein
MTGDCKPLIVASSQTVKSQQSNFEIGESQAKLLTEV